MNPERGRLAKPLTFLLIVGLDAAYMALGLLGTALGTEACTEGNSCF
jgi:hypothetical protein